MRHKIVAGVLILAASAAALALVGGAVAAQQGDTVPLFDTEAGIAIGFATDIAHLVEELQMYRPTTMAAVPRIFEKIYTLVTSNAPAELIGTSALDLVHPDDLDNVKKVQAGYKVQPLSAYLKVRDARHSFLLESAESTDKSGRWSIIGTNPRRVIEARDKNEISRLLHISPHTVKDHIKAIYEKTHTKGIASLIALLVRLGNRDSEVSRGPRAKLRFVCRRPGSEEVLGP